MSCLVWWISSHTTDLHGMVKANWLAAALCPTPFPYLLLQACGTGLPFTSIYCFVGIMLSQLCISSISFTYQVLKGAWSDNVYPLHVLLSKWYVSSLIQVSKMSQESYRNIGLTPTVVKLVRIYVDEDQATFANWCINWEDYNLKI